MRKAQKVGAQKTEKVFETGAKKASEAAKAFKKGIKEGIEERKNAHVGKERDSRNTSRLRHNHRLS